MRDNNMQGENSLEEINPEPLAFNQEIQRALFYTAVTCFYSVFLASIIIAIYFTCPVPLILASAFLSGIYLLALYKTPYHNNKFRWNYMVWQRRSFLFASLGYLTLTSYLFFSISPVILPRWIEIFSFGCLVFSGLLFARAAYLEILEKRNIDLMLLEPTATQLTSLEENKTNLTTLKPIETDLTPSESISNGGKRAALTSSLIHLTKPLMASLFCIGISLHAVELSHTLQTADNRSLVFKVLISIVAVASAAGIVFTLKHLYNSLVSDFTLPSEYCGRDAWYENSFSEIKTLRELTKKLETSRLFGCPDDLRESSSEDRGMSQPALTINS